MRTSSPVVRVTIICVVGAVLCLAVILGVYIGLISPANAAIQAANNRYNAAYNDSTLSAQNEAQDELNKANAYAAATMAAWKLKEHALMPPFDVSKRYLAWGQLAHELSENLGPMLERWMAHNGVTTTSSVSIEAPPASPNGITGAPLIIPIGGGTVSVIGDFHSILSSVQRWNDFNRLVLIDKLELTGNSPLMNASYGAAVIIFPQNAENIGGEVAQSGGGAESSGGGGPNPMAGADAAVAKELSGHG